MCVDGCVCGGEGRGGYLFYMRSEVGADGPQTPHKAPVILLFIVHLHQEDKEINGKNCISVLCATMTGGAATPPPLHIHVHTCSCLRP